MQGDAATKCLCPTLGKWRGWSSLCPIHGCPSGAKSVLRGFPRDMVAWEDVEIGLRGVLSAAWAFDAAMCLKSLDWIVVRDA